MGERWSDSRCILKVDLVGFHLRLDVTLEVNRVVGDDSMIFA